MKKFITLLAILISAGLYAQKDKAYHNHLHQEGIDDFKSETAEFQYSEKGKFTYLISNDRENIYVDLRFTDVNVKRQVLSSGVTIWINTDGKNSKKTGVRFPVRQQYQKGRERPGQGMPPRDRNQPPAGNIWDVNLMDAALIELTGFSESGPVTVANNEQDNFRGSVRAERTGHLLFELIMPFAKLPPISDNPGKKNKSHFTLGISYESGPEMGGSYGGMSGGGMPSGGGRSGGGGSRSGGGGGRPSGQSGGGAPPSSGTASQTLVWIKDIRLAAEK